MSADESAPSCQVTGPSVNTSEQGHQQWPEHLDVAITQMQEGPRREAITVNVGEKCFHQSRLGRFKAFINTHSSIPTAILHHHHLQMPSKAAVHLYGFSYAYGSCSVEGHGLLLYLLHNQEVADQLLFRYNFAHLQLLGLQLQC